MKTVIALLVCSAVAHADSVPTRARTLAERGRAAHDQRDYSAAIAAFTEAYAIAPAPALLFNLAQAYRLAGRCDDAALMYRRFLASAPTDDARALAELHLSTVERCAKAKEMKVVADHAIVQVRLPPAPPPPPPHDVDRSWSTARKTGIGIAIGGAAALAVAGFYGLDAYQTSNEVERRYEGGEKWNKLAALDRSGQRAQTIAEIAGTTGVLAVAIGATVLYVDHRHAKRRLDVSPSLAGRGARVSLAWQF